MRSIRRTVSHIAGQTEPPASDAARGDADDCFARYEHDIYRWAFRITGSHADSLDVGQDVYLRWRASCARDVPANPRAWLRRAAINRAIDEYRAARARPTAPAVEIAVDARDTTAGDGARLQRDVARALADLSEMQREVLLAKILEDLTFAEIASDLEISASTAKTHFFRAVTRVRDQLRPRWNNED